MIKKMCGRCECSCECCQELMADGVSADVRHPTIRLEEVQPGVWLFLDYGNDESAKSLRQRWVIRVGVYPDGSLQLYSPTLGVTHERALHLIRRELSVVPEAMSQLRRKLRESAV